MNQLVTMWRGSHTLLENYFESSLGTLLRLRVSSHFFHKGEGARNTTLFPTGNCLWKRVIFSRKLYESFSSGYFSHFPENILRFSKKDQTRQLVRTSAPVSVGNCEN